MDKVKLAPLYIPAHGIVGKANDLLPVYDILHCVFRCVLLPPRLGIKTIFMVILWI